MQRQSQGALIRARRAELGLSRGALAREMNKSPAFLVQVERDERRLTLPATVEAAARALHLTADEVWHAGGRIPADIAAFLVANPSVWPVIRRVMSKPPTPPA